MAFETLVKAYNDFKLSFIKEIGDIHTYLYEIPFVDDSLIRHGIESRQKKYNEIVNKIEAFTDVENVDREMLSGLMDSEKHIRVELAMLISHRIEDIDYCISLVDNINCDYKLCLYAIKAYAEKDYSRSLSLFYDYIATADRMPETYVANKMIAHILFEQGEYSKAVSFLRYAVSKKPDDLEIHRMLQTCYDNLNRIQEFEVERQIVEILEASA